MVKLVIFGLFSLLLSSSGLPRRSRKREVLIILCILTFWNYALCLPAHCVRGRLSALLSPPAFAGMTGECERKQVSECLLPLSDPSPSYKIINKRHSHHSTASGIYHHYYARLYTYIYLVAGVLCYLHMIRMIKISYVNCWLYILYIPWNNRTILPMHSTYDRYNSVHGYTAVEHRHTHPYHELSLLAEHLHD